jgi:hypothetical protein
MSSLSPALRRRRHSWLARVCVATISIFGGAVGLAVPAPAAALADGGDLPSGAVPSVTVHTTPGSGTVDVTWEPLDEAGWNGPEQDHYEVHITAPEGAHPTDGCDTLIAGTDCLFIADTGGDYTATVQATNQYGSSSDSTSGTGTVVLDAPTGPVANPAAVSTNGPDNDHADVSVTWDALAPDAWPAGGSHEYHVTVDSPDDVTPDLGSCAGDVTEEDHSCTFTTTRSGQYRIRVVPANEVGSGEAAEATVDVGLAPDAPVGNLRPAAHFGEGRIDLSWDPLPEDDWNGDTHHYDVEITAAGDGSVADDSDCRRWADEDATGVSGCSFTVGATDQYTMTVTAVNESGRSAQFARISIPMLVGPPSEHVAVTAHTDPGSGVVDVSWTPPDAASWSDADPRFYSLAVTGPGETQVTDLGSCGSPIDGANSGCSFSVDTPGDYQIQLMAISQEGYFGIGFASARVTLGPIGTVSDLTAAVEPGTSTVTVRWSRLDDSDWAAGGNRAYRVSVERPEGSELSYDTCTTEDLPDSDTPGCQFDAGAEGDYTVTVVPVTDAGTGTGEAATTTVHLTPPEPALPVATVTGLRVRPVPGTTTVPVSWDAVPTDDRAWNHGVTHEYVVTVTGPEGATVDPGTCTTVSSSSCEFTTDRPGDYTVEVALRNEAGTSANTASDTGHLTLAAPSGQVGNVTTTGIPGSGGVEVSWNALTGDEWSSGNERSYTATIGGDLHVVENTCDSVPADQTSCYFESDTSGPFTVTVKAVNEVGPAATGGSADGTVILAPSVAVSGLLADTSIDSPTVTVSWSPLTTGWENGESRQYAVSVDGPDGAELSDDGCSMGPVADTDSPGCTFDVSVGGDYTVRVQPANEGGPGPVAEATAHVTLRPTATVEGLTVGTEPGSPTVNVSWDALPAAGWNGGSTDHYVITVQAPSDAAIDDNTCTTVDDTKDPHCGFTTDAPGDYTVQVAVANEAGTAGTPATGTGTLAMGKPAAATAVSGVSGTNAITASWTAAVPTSLAGVGSYTVSAIAKGYPAKSCTGTVTISPCTIADVAAGVPYTVRVVTNGPGGSSDPADSAGTVLPTGAPKAPVEVPGNAVPAGSSTGLPGAPVTITGSGYQPYSTVVLSLFSAPESVGTTTADGNGNISVTVYLPPGTPTGSHTLLATGLDANGAVLNLAKSVAVTVNAPPVWTPVPVTTTPPTTTPPTTSPSPTTSPTATPPTGAVASLAARQIGPDRRSAVVTWAAGQVSWGDGAGRGYDVSVTGPRGAQITGSCTAMVAGTATSCQFDTDINGAYAVRVTAVTGAGRSGQAAAATATVTTAPGEPTAVTGTPGANSISVSWKAPASVGAGIRGYTVTAIAPSYPARGCGAVTRSPCTIIGLAAGVRYVARVVAVGPGGNSPAASSAGTISPIGTVQVPRDVPAGAVSNGSRVAGPGADVTIVGTGFRPGTRVRAAIYPGGTSLTATTASAKGTASIHVTMPARGSYVVLAIGLDKGGRARYLSTALRVRTPAAAVAGTPVKARLVSGTPVTAQTAVTDAGTGGSTASRLAGTGTNSEPVVLAGFLMLMTGLLLTSIRTGSRRTARRHA